MMSCFFFTLADVKFIMQTNSVLSKRTNPMELKLYIFAFLLCISASTVLANRFDHAIWDNLLREHVHMTQQEHTSRVNYSGFALYHGLLSKYLSQLSQVKKSDFSNWNKAEQLAFLINAYNAFTIEMMLRSYSSIATVRAYAPVNIHWKSRLVSMIKNQQKINFIPLFGEFLSLKELEEQFIRKPGKYDEPRIHFALNRASIDCPALLDRAYTGIELDQQLESATRAFLSDRSRNRYNEEAGRLEVSEIFDWYEDDFERGWQGWLSLSHFFSYYRNYIADTAHAQEILTTSNFEIHFLEFNWMLNEKLQ